MARYEEAIEAASKRAVCASCGRVLHVRDIHELVKGDPRLRLLAGKLDLCGQREHTWNLCSACLTSFSQQTIPKFSAKNLVNVTLCQHYPAVLEDLTPVEECLIAKCHPIGIVLKLRPGGHSSPVSYRAVRGHFIIIPQDPKPLLRILPSPDLSLDNLIKVLWAGRDPPVEAELRPFLLVRKFRVLAALQYLVQHNQIYQDVAINYYIIDDWTDEFIPPDVRDNIIYLDKPDSCEREGYTLSLRRSNCENDLQAAQDDSFDAGESEPLTTGSVSTDINGERQNPDKRLLSTLLELVSNRSQQQNNRHSVPVISYTVRGRITLVDQWTDPHYFTAAFPTLFPTGTGGHLEDRPFSVSLGSFMEWALTHHSRRFARHKTFMYLGYDMLQLRTSSLANRLLIQRQNWKSATDDIADLTEDRLLEALKALEQHYKIEDPLIRRLLHAMECIAMRVAGSFAQKLRFRAEIRGLIIRLGMPAFWITINPSDLRNPLVLILAGVHYSGDIFAASNSAIREATATSNPVAVAEFFHNVCKAIFDSLLGSNTGKIGILGDVSNHYGVVETNGRGMLHLHALVWVRGNLGFNTLRKHILEDAVFAARMISYLEKIIIQGIDENMPHDPEANLSPLPPSTLDVQSDSDFHLRLSYDSNLVAQRKQVHSKHHFATCFKYRPNHPNKDSCRFGMPRDLVSFPRVDKLGVIHLARNHAWINPWNPALASCVRSNHDISWIPTVAKSLSLIYYVTNYAAKDDVSPWQMVAKAALLRQSLEKARVADPPTEADLRLREKGMNNFALRCFNTLAHDREVSGVQVASTLLHLPSYYTVNYNFVSVNLWWLRQYVRAMTHPQELHGTIGEEACTYKVGDTAPVSLFDNYKWRGKNLTRLTFFEYCMLVRMRDKQGATAIDFDFDAAHPRFTTHIQRLAQKPAHVATVAFKGQLTQFQAAEDAISGGHPATEAIVNDVTEILLGLFVPWHDLSAILSQFTTQENMYSTVWAIVEPNLAPHNREFAANIELLRKSKEDCQADAKLRTSAHLNDDFFDRQIADLDQGGFDSDSDEHDEDFQAQSENFTAENTCRKSAEASVKVTVTRRERLHRAEYEGGTDMFGEYGE